MPKRAAASLKEVRIQPDQVVVYTSREVVSVMPQRLHGHLVAVNRHSGSGPTETIAPREESSDWSAWHAEVEKVGGLVSIRLGGGPSTCSVIIDPQRRLGPLVRFVGPKDDTQSIP